MYTYRSIPSLAQRREQEFRLVDQFNASEMRYSGTLPKIILNRAKASVRAGFDKRSLLDGCYIRISPYFSPEGANGDI